MLCVSTARNKNRPHHRCMSLPCLRRQSLMGWVVLVVLEGVLSEGQPDECTHQCLLAREFLTTTTTIDPEYLAHEYKQRISQSR